MSNIIISIPDKVWKLTGDSFLVDEFGVYIIKNQKQRAFIPHGQFNAVIHTGDWPKITEKEVTFAD